MAGEEVGHETGCAASHVDVSQTWMEASSPADATYAPSSDMVSDEMALKWASTTESSSPEHTCGARPCIAQRGQTGTGSPWNRVHTHLPGVELPGSAARKEKGAIGRGEHRPHPLGRSALERHSLLNLARKSGV